VLLAQVYVRSAAAAACVRINYSNIGDVCFQKEEDAPVFG